MKKISFFLFVFMLALLSNAQTAATKKHEIQPGETLYSIARKYNVAVSVLQQLNPSLQPDHIMAGQKLNVPAGTVLENVTEQPAAQQPSKPTVISASSVIPQGPSPVRPQYKAKHEVQKKETVYSLARQYDVSEDELIAANPQLKNGKLKKGAVINIPYSAQEIAQYQAELKRLADEAKKASMLKNSAIKVAVILPFSRTEATMTAESQKMANLYQGFLLAVDSLKQHGFSVEVYAYDEMGVSINNILQASAMKDMQLIVGPARQYNVNSVANFAHEHNITHVVPLSNEAALVNEHPMTYQVNVPSSSLYSQVFNRFVVLHKNDNIVFINMNDRGDNASYVSSFQKHLSENSIAYRQISIDNAADLKDLLKTTSHNVIIPSSGTSAAFDNLTKKLEALSFTSEYDVQLFGFPEWQVFSAKHEKLMSKYRCQFFTSFYSNGGTARAQSFNSRFHRWFKQDQYSSIPRYGELGYDIGVYFLKGLREFGTSLNENLHNYSYHSLEFPFNFERKNAWSGYQNKSVLIVTHRQDGTVVVK